MLKNNFRLPNPNQLLVIGGATASGKTAFAIALAQRLQTEIVSADSRQIYREMHIGTAKPTAAELASVPHHLVDCTSIHAPYSAGDYEREALAILAKLFKKNNQVVLVGGTGLYIRALCEGLDEFPEIPPHFRTELEAEMAQNGIEALQQELAERDAVQFATMDKQNPVRLIRALSVVRATDKPFSSFQRQAKTARPFEIQYFHLALPRPELYARIDRRVDAMAAQGLQAEAESLYSLRHLDALNTVGYKEWFDYFDGKYTNAGETIDKIKQHTRNYAKRQLTWLRKDAHWQTVSNHDDVSKIAEITKSILD